MDARPAAKASPLPMILGIVGGALLLIGSFLTWASVSIDVTKFAEALGVDPTLLQGSIGSTSQSFSGMNDKGDGIFTLIAGLVVIVLAVVLLIKADLGKVMGALMIGAGAIGAGVALYDLSRVNNVKDDALNGAAGALQGAGIDPAVLDGVIKVSAGIGIWVCALGGLIAVLAGIMALMSKRSAAPAMTSPMGTSTAPAASGFESSSPAAPPMSTPPAPQPPAPDMTPSTPDAPSAPDVSTPSAPDVSTPSTPEPPSAPEPPSSPEPPSAPGGDPGGGSTTP
jgi:hypothetical protein